MQYPVVAANRGLTGRSVTRRLRRPACGQECAVLGSRRGSETR